MRISSIPRKSKHKKQERHSPLRSRIQASHAGIHATHAPLASGYSKPGRRSWKRWVWGRQQKREKRVGRIARSFWSKRASVKLDLRRFFHLLSPVAVTAGERKRGTGACEPSAQLCDARKSKFEDELPACLGVIV